MSAENRELDHERGKEAEGTEQNARKKGKVKRKVTTGPTIICTRNYASILPQYLFTIYQYYWNSVFFFFFFLLFRIIGNLLTLKNV